MLLSLVPTLGLSPWLRETVDSLRRASGGAVRVVAIAPASVHPALRTVEGIDNVLSDEEAVGLYGALNVGRRWAANQDWQWITWLADDDVVLPGFRALTEASLGVDSVFPSLVAGHVAYLNEAGERLCRVPRLSHPRDALPLLAAGVSPMNPQGMLYSRAAWELAGDFPNGLRVCGDVDHWSAALLRGASLHLFDVEAAGFRLRRGQLSGDLRVHRAEFAQVQARVEDSIAPASLPTRWRFRWDNRRAYLERLKALGFKRGQSLLG